MLKLASHNIYEGGSLPPFRAGVLYEYWLAAGGVYLRAKRAGMEVLLPVAAGEIRGLPRLDPYLRLDYPPVPWPQVIKMVDLARQALDTYGQPLEKLFHLSFDGEETWSWRLEVPAQVQTAGSVRPLSSGAGSSYERAILELHSHHSLAAFFSDTDDRDEARSFRLFAVLGRIFDSRPEIRVRVGVFGYFWQVEARQVLDIPEWLHDCALDHMPDHDAVRAIYKESEDLYYGRT